MEGLFLTSIMMSLIVIAFLLHRKFKGEGFSSKVYYILWIVIAIRLILPFDMSLNNPVYKFTSPLENSVYNQNYTSSNLSNFNNENINKSEAIKIEDNKSKENKIGNDKIKNNKNEGVNLNTGDKTIALKSKLINILAVLNKNIFNIWLAGTSIYLLYNLAIYAVFKINLKKSIYQADEFLEEKLNRLKSNMNINKNISLNISSMVDSPMIVGIIKPVLVIPRGMDLSNIDYIFRHELVHLKRRDILYKGLIFLAAAVHWFNPIVHLMLKVSGEDLELSCDEEVVKGMSRDQRITYSKTLIGAISRGRSPIYTTNFSGGADMIKKRIDKIFVSVNKKSSRPLILILVLSMLTSSFLIGCDKKEEENLTDKLYKNKTEFIGDNSKVSGIAGSLEYPKGYEYESIEIYSKDEDNGNGLNQLTIMFKEDNNREYWADEKDFITQSALLFSLIDNLDLIVYTMQEKDINTAFAGSERDNADSFTTSVLGMTTKELGSNKGKFKSLVEYYKEYNKEDGGENNHPSDNAFEAIGNENDELKIDIKPETITREGLVLIIENKSDKDFIYLSEFVLQRKVENEWKDAESILKPGEDAPEGLQTYPLKSKEKAEHEIKFNSKYKNLNPGYYRIVERIIQDDLKHKTTHDLAVEFNIKQDSSIGDVGNITNSIGELSLNIKYGNATPTGLTLIIENNSEKEYSTDDGFILYKRLGENEWEELADFTNSEAEDDNPDIKEDNIKDLEAFKLKAKGKLEQYVQWDSLGKLEDGEYGIIKKILNKESENNYITYSIGQIFEIKSDQLKPIEAEKPSGELELDETINSLSGVKMLAKVETISEKGLTLILENKSGLEYIFSEDFFIQKQTGNSWEDVKPILKEGQYGFNDIALVLPAKGSTDWAVDWNWLYGSLEKGQYRIVKTVIGDAAPGEKEAHYMGAEFEIK